MSTSRVHTPDPVHSLPELIPAAGTWTRNEHSYPASQGTDWYAVGGGLTDRRKQKVQDSLADERQIKAGTFGQNAGSFKHRALAARKAKATNFYDTSRTFQKHDLDKDWLKQKRDSRPLRGQGSWTSPLLNYQGSSKGPKGTMGIPLCDRTEEVERVCDSTGIPGVSWGQLLARERRIDRLGLPADEVVDGRVVLKSTSLSMLREVANAELSVDKKRQNNLERFHPLGREASFHDGLRSTRRRKPKLEEWDSSSTIDPAPRGPKHPFQQEMLKISRDARTSWTKAQVVGMRPSRGAQRKAAEAIIEEMEEEQRLKEEYLREYAGQQRLLVTGGSWDLSRQLALSALAPPVPHKGLGVSDEDAKVASSKESADDQKKPKLPAPSPSLSTEPAPAKS